MNVYSVELIPSLKIKFCQWIGCATTMAVAQLSDRLHRVEKKIDRFEAMQKKRRFFKIPSLHQKFGLGN